MADIYFYNYLTAQKEKFTPIKKDFVGLYTCGPTVYDYVHIGNLRTYLFEDILRRVLEFNNYSVKQVMNLTDIEDKIIAKMKATNKTLIEVTQPFSDSFFADIKTLNIQPASVYPKATEHVQEMIEIISTLLKKGVAYQKEGSVYFSLEKFPNYGQLSKLEKRELKVGARVKVDEYSKDNAEDFVLWKETEKGEPTWDAPFGAGRPGWHIECSGMSMKYLGESFDQFGKLKVNGEDTRTIDIHTGGVDNIFPHHENEIAQSEAYSGKKFVIYWLEGEHLLVDNQKMSKSLGNIITLQTMIAKNINPLAFRYLVLTAHYRSKLNFTWDSLQSSSNALNNLYEGVSSLGKLGTEDAGFINQFVEAINDDLDMPKALAIVWELLKSNIDNGVKGATLVTFDRVLGLGLKGVIISELPEEIRELAALRFKLRQDKNFIEADKVRTQIEEKGYLVKDTAIGVNVSKKFNRNFSFPKKSRIVKPGRN